MTIREAAIKSKYDCENVAGNEYHTVTIIESNVIVPAILVLPLASALQDDNFAFGVVQGRLVFIFRNKRDALYFQCRLKSYSEEAPRNGEVNQGPFH